MDDIKHASKNYQDQGLCLALADNTIRSLDTVIHTIMQKPNSIIIVYMHVLKVSANTQGGILETQHPMMCQLVNNFIFKTFCSVFSKVLTFKKANFTEKNLF